MEAAPWANGRGRRPRRRKHERSVSASALLCPWEDRPVPAAVRGGPGIASRCLRAGGERARGGCSSRGDPHSCPPSAEVPASLLRPAGRASAPVLALNFLSPGGGRGGAVARSPPGIPRRRREGAWKTPSPRRRLPPTLPPSGQPHSLACAPVFPSDSGLHLAGRLGEEAGGSRPCPWRRVRAWRRRARSRGGEGEERLHERRGPAGDRRLAGRFPPAAARPALPAFPTLKPLGSSSP